MRHTPHAIQIVGERSKGPSLAHAIPVLVRFAVCLIVVFRLRALKRTNHTTRDIGGKVSLCTPNRNGGVLLGVLSNIACSTATCGSKDLTIPRPRKLGLLANIHEAHTGFFVHVRWPRRSGPLSTIPSLTSTQAWTSGAIHTHPRRRYCTIRRWALRLRARRNRHLSGDAIVLGRSGANASSALSIASSNRKSRSRISILSWRAACLRP